MSERPLINLVLQLFSQLGGKLSRNNSGRLQDREGRYVNYGCFSPGGSDLIGFLPTTITPDMVGKKVAIFTALEIKIGRTKATPAQAQFVQVVRTNGGIAHFIHDTITHEELCALTKFPP